MAPASRRWSVPEAEPTRLGIVDCGLRIDAGASLADVTLSAVQSAIINRQSAIVNHQSARSPPTVAEFIHPDGGKTAHYMLRWLSTRDEASPWSETASAAIGA